MQGGADIIEVLSGADTEKVQRWRHTELSTYGIGKERRRKEWAVIGRELLRLGLLRQSTGKFSVLELTEEGRHALSQRRSIALTQPVDMPETESRRARENSYDEVLFERLRGLRKKLADERGVPAYIIFSDAALRQMAGDTPADIQEFTRVSGVGEKKLQEFSREFLAGIALHLLDHPRMREKAIPGDPSCYRNCEVEEKVDPPGGRRKIAS